MSGRGMQAGKDQRIELLQATGFCPHEGVNSLAYGYKYSQRSFDSERSDPNQRQSHSTSS